MRVEQHHGEFLLLGDILPPERVEPGQVWAGVSGHKVTVSSVKQVDDMYWVTYQWFEKKKLYEHTKDSFCFQCRYSLVLPDDKLPEWVTDR